VATEPSSLMASSSDDQSYEYIAEVSTTGFPTSSEKDIIAYIFFGERFEKRLDSLFWTNPWFQLALLGSFCFGALGFLIGLTGVFPGCEYFGYFSIGVIPYNVAWSLLFSWPILKVCLAVCTAP